MDFPFPLQIDFDNQSWHSMPLLDCGKSLPFGRLTPWIDTKAPYRSASLNDLIRLQQHRRRNRDPECPCGPEIDHQSVLRGLLDCEIRGLSAFQDLVDV